MMMQASVTVTSSGSTSSRQQVACGCWRVAAMLMVLAAILLDLMAPSRAQKLPTRDEDLFQFNIDRTEIFFDTKLLPDGAEVTTYLYKDIERRFFFMVEEDDTPVSIIVTPCASAVEWKLTIRDLPEETSADASVEEYEDPLMQQEASLRPTLEAGDSPVLHTYSGTGVDAFHTPDSQAGIYVLELRTTETDSSVRMYATTTPHSDYPYPDLPSDPKVAVEKVSRHRVAVTWKPSPTSTLHGQEVDYCVAVNAEHNFQTECAALAYVNGDIPPTAPPNAGFGFAWEKERDRALAGRTTAAPVPTRDPADASYTCIGHKTSYSINNLQAGKKYYIDVFVLHENRSTAYHGVSVKTKQNVKKTTLKEGKVLTTFIKRNRGEKLFKYNLKRPTEKLLLSIHPCFGELKVEVEHNGHRVLRQTVQEFDTLVLPNATRGTYLISVSTRRRHSAYFKISMARRASKIPYPVLPEDTTIKVFDSRRTCNSLTVAWLGLDKKYQYCLFAKPVEETDNPLNRLLSRWNKCISPSSRKKNEKIMCRNVRFKNKNRAVVTEQIRGLKPNTQYVLDVYISKVGGRGETLSYQSAWVTTTDTC